ncbi:MAG: hypothetical protein SRB2_00510 [Desulfobacteraceae bacterium Eth-SRB2]|nr:MAG: hypothetical protein SRB2_00510 [Desulfobacteraceae bacterium Eth-SRB2]
MRTFLLIQGRKRLSEFLTLNLNTDPQYRTPDLGYVGICGTSNGCPEEF